MQCGRPPRFKHVVRHGARKAPGLENRERETKPRPYEWSTGRMDTSAESYVSTAPSSWATSAWP